MKIWAAGRRIGAGNVAPILVFAIVIGSIALAFSNLMANLRARNIASGFDYIFQIAGFEIGESWIAYTAQMSTGRALLAGFINTIIAGGATALLITVIGAAAGLALSFGGAYSRTLLKYYVALTRNVPVLLHLVVWYAVFRETLPTPRGALSFGSIALSNRGLFLPYPRDFGGSTEIAIAVIAASVSAFSFRAVRGRWSLFWIAAAIGIGLLTWLISLPMNVPVLRGFNFVGGWTITPEFCALVLALGIYTGGYVTEIVRGAIDNFPKGQVEGAFSIGLSRTQFFLLILIPQLVRAIAPAMVNQYLNVIKGTSLGIIVGYPDLVTVSNTSLNQTGQAIEAVLIIMMTYLVISLLVSFLASRLASRRFSR